ncbi:protein maelstrom homolog [Chrysoperla carnea]|uniref:protein maelstrom homolog n=1 Tax=Chrysoperla carnea TaxID=189513 RepID=UPI001D05C8AA|nr:protein maelstrom homolog [Chrysoperla carnea]
MAPKKSKGSTSAYYFYMLHVQNRHPGRPIGLAEAARIAGPEWERMSKNQRAPFQKLADEEKMRQKGSGDKFDSYGRSYAYLDNEKEIQTQKEESMRKNVKERIEIALINDTLVQEEFFFIDINIFCEVYDKEYEKYFYYPAEIAISKYTLKDGVSKTYHSAINPGRVRTGYTRTAQQHSDETHQLPIPPDALGEKDMNIILKQVLEFLKDNCNKSTLPYLYTLPKQIQIVEGVLSQLCNEREICIDFKIFSLPELFMYLMNATASAKDKFDTPTIAQLAIEKDVYDYYKRLACDYHETTDVLHMCSLSKVKRWGFIISDYCLQFLDVPVILGQHLPEQVDSSLIKNDMGSRCESRAESEFTTVSRKSQARSIKSNSVCSTPAPSIISEAPLLQRKNQSGAIKKVPMERSHSPTESVTSYVSNMSLNSNQDPNERVYTPNIIDFPLLSNRNTDSASTVGRLEQIRRPKTQSQVSGQVKGSAASLLGYTTDTSATDSTWSNMAKKRSQMKSAGRGRSMAANFSNP